MITIGKVLGLLVAISLVCAPVTAQVSPVLPVIPTNQFKFQEFGAVGDGVATNTKAIQAAMDAARAAGGGTIQIPKGVFLSGPFQFASAIRLQLDEGAVLRMLPLDKYPGGTTNPSNFITASRLHDVAISGRGSIDGQGSPWWPFAKQTSARRPRMIAISGCERVLIENVTLSNAPMFHISMSGVSDVTVRGVTIRAPASTDPVNPSHNTDACDVSGKRVLIQDCDVSVGDDNFTCGGNTSDVLITNCTYGNGHGVSIGSPTRGGVSNLTVINCTFNNTDCGIRIKSDRDRGGYIHNLRYENLRMTNVGIPILIYGAYAVTNREFRALQQLTPEIAARYPAAPVTALTPIYRDIVFRDITATAKAGNRAGLIWGLPEMAVSNVVLERVNIRADKPFGVFGAQNVQLRQTQIVTPEGTNRLAATNASIVIAASDGTSGKYNAVVAADGSGAYKTVQEAVAAVPDNSPTPYVIFIKPGTYQGQILVPMSKRNLQFLGGDLEKTILTYALNQNETNEQVGLKHKGTGVVILSDDFRAENITFQNTSGDHGQAQALRMEGDRAILKHCRMLGWQDTLYINNGRHYFTNCYVEGRVDFIYGSAMAVFDRCEIRSKNGGHITAASTPQGQPFGFAFLDCRLTGDPTPWADPTRTTSGPSRVQMADLGRPWRPYGCVAYIRCEIGNHIKPEGWNNWNNAANEQTARYSEYRSTGPGANPDARFKWTKQLTDDEAKSYTVENILKGGDGWNPAH